MTSMSNRAKPNLPQQLKELEDVYESVFGPGSAAKLYAVEGTMGNLQQLIALAFAMDQRVQGATRTALQQERAAELTGVPELAAGPRKTQAAEPAARKTPRHSAQSPQSEVRLAIIRRALREGEGKDPHVHANLAREARRLRGDSPRLGPSSVNEQALAEVREKLEQATDPEEIAELAREARKLREALE
jgi:hypothetical protein